MVRKNGKEEKVKTEKIAEVKGASLRPAYSSSLLLLQRVRQPGCWLLFCRVYSWQGRLTVELVLILALQFNFPFTDISIGPSVTKGPCR
jgi:hypothetical protein